MSRPGNPGRPGRPMGALGECGQAFLAEAMRQPGTVRELAHRAQVGVPVAVQVAKRMVQRGQLVPLPLPNGAQRPRVLAPAPLVPAHDEAAQGNVFLVLSLSLWPRR